MTDPTKTPAEITRLLMEPFPADVIDDKQGMLYVPAEIVRMRLIDATDNQFDWHLDRTEFRLDGASIRTDKQTKDRLEVPVAVAYGHLTIPGLGTRAGVGVQEIQPGGGADSAYKGAESDALKRAAMQFGVGLQQLYIETGEAKREKKQPNRQQQNRQPRPQPAQTRTTATQANDADPRGLMPMPDFTERFSLALFAKDARELKHLMDGAADSIEHWVAMADLAGDAKQLRWVKDEMEKRGMSRVPAFDTAYKARAAALRQQEG